MTFEIEKQIAEISSTNSSAKWLTLTAWNGRPAKLDLRLWRTEDDEPKPGKGITLTDEEAQILLHALQAYFNGLQDAEP